MARIPVADASIVRHPWSPPSLVSMEMKSPMILRERFVLSLCLCCHMSWIAVPWRHPPPLRLTTPPPAIPSLLDAHSPTTNTTGIKSLSRQHREAVRRLPAALPLMPPITATTTVQYWTDGGAFIRRRATTVLCPASCARLRLRLHVGQHEGTCPVLSFPLSYLAVAADRRQQRLRPRILRYNSRLQ